MVVWFSLTLSGLSSKIKVMSWVVDHDHGGNVANIVGATSLIVKSADFCNYDERPLTGNTNHLYTYCIMYMYTV